MTEHRLDRLCGAIERPMQLVDDLLEARGGNGRRPKFIHQVKGLAKMRAHFLERIAHTDHGRA